MKYSCSWLFIACMLPGSWGHSQVNNISLSQTFHDYALTRSGGADQYSNNYGSMRTFNDNQEPEGSPYLFNDWVTGKVILKNASVFQEPGKLLNYDKMKNVLVVKIANDNSKVLNVNMDEIDKFFLEDSGKTVAFVQIPEKPAVFLMEMYKDSLCTLYKQVNTKFYKADYVNKGLYETGYKYDRYVDENTYYLRQSGKFSPVSNIKKELKKLAQEFPQLKEILATITTA